MVTYSPNTPATLDVTDWIYNRLIIPAFRWEAENQKQSEVEFDTVVTQVAAKISANTQILSLPDVVVGNIRIRKRKLCIAPKNEKETYQREFINVTIFEYIMTQDRETLTSGPIRTQVYITRSYIEDDTCGIGENELKCRGLDVVVYPTVIVGIHTGSAPVNGNTGEYVNLPVVPFDALISLNRHYFKNPPLSVWIPGSDVPGFLSVLKTLPYVYGERLLGGDPQAWLEFPNRIPQNDYVKISAAEALTNHVLRHLAAYQSKQMG